MAPGTGQTLLLEHGRKGVISLQLQCGAGLVRRNARRRRQKGAMPLKNRGAAACIHALFLLLGERGMATVAAERRLGIVMDQLHRLASHPWSHAFAVQAAAPVLVLSSMANGATFC